MPRWSSIERELRLEGARLIAGVDEVGRGPLAGPVVACAIVMPPDARAIAGVDDSKALTAPERERLAILIRARALAISLGAASVREIAALNIYQATVLAMRRALHAPARLARRGAHRRQADPDARDRAPRRGRRRRPLLQHRLRVDHREGDARPADGFAFCSVSGLRLGAERGLRHARALFGPARGRAHGTSSCRFLPSRYASIGRFVHYAIGTTGAGRVI